MRQGFELKAVLKRYLKRQVRVTSVIRTLRFIVTHSLSPLSLLSYQLLEGLDGLVAQLVRAHA